MNHHPLPAEPAHRTQRRSRALLILLGAVLFLSACEYLPILAHPTADLCPGEAELWSDTTTWGDGLPAAGDEVVVPEDRIIALDTDTPDLAGIDVRGTLVVCRRDTTVTAGWIMVHGALQAGSPEDPFTHDLTITLTGTTVDPSAMGMGTRGIIIMNGQLHLFGDPTAVPWTKIREHVPAGSDTLPLIEPVDWEVGDQVLITSTDWYGTAQTEVRTVIEVDGDEIRVDQPLSDPRWGVLQHVTSTGMALSPDPSLVAPEGAPLVLDERAEVANLSRNIVIQAPDDADWQNEGFGAHVMAMGATSRMEIEGVEVLRGGQAGRLGRYPFHWHRLSYGPDGSLWGDATGQYVRSSTVFQSANRCITIHATNGVEVSDNVCFDIRGHGVFLEDAVERRNVIRGNLVARLRNPASDDILKAHEVAYESGASGFWLSNPDNEVSGNSASDAQGFGFWMAFPNAPVSSSSNVPIAPDLLSFGSFVDNTAHSNGHEGLMFDFAEIDNAGNVYPNQYASTSDGEPISWPFDTLQRFSLEGFTTWKNQFGGFWNRATVPDYTGFVSADNEDRYFAGAGADGVIAQSLVVNTSLNSATPRPHPWLTSSAFATYHSAFDIRDNVVVGFSIVEGERSGMFATDDYYIRPVDKGQIRNSGNLLIDSHGGLRVDRPSPNYALAGALWDPHGLWGPSGRYFVYDDPFLTEGTTCAPENPAGANGVSCVGPYYGFVHFVVDQANVQWDGQMPIEVTRFDTSGAPVGTWSVGDGTVLSAFGIMRHFATRGDGSYLLDFPGSTTPTDVAMTVENMLDSSDSSVIGIRFDGSDPAEVFTTTYYFYLDPEFTAEPSSPVKSVYQAVGSLEDVVSSPGETYWQDTANDVVWVKVMGGLEQVTDLSGFEETSDELLYDSFVLRVH